MRYFNTVIVTADIDEGFGQSACRLPHTPPTLTFSHRSGVTPYTSSYEFAGSCVFGKQSPEILSLRPTLRQGRLIPKLRLAFLPSSLTKIHPFPLGSSPHPPVSDYSTGSFILTLGVFLGNALRRFVQNSVSYSSLLWGSRLNAGARICLYTTLDQERQTIKTLIVLRFVPPSKIKEGLES